MKLKDFNLLIVMCLLTLNLIAQNKVSGFVNNEEVNSPINNIEIFSKESGKLTTTNKEGYFEFTTHKKKITLIFFSPACVVSFFSSF